MRSNSPLPHLWAGTFQSFLTVIIFCCAITVQNAVSAQVFKPFNAETKAMYTTWPEKGPTSSLSFIDISEQDSDSVFNTLKIIDPEAYEDMIEPDETCTDGFWGTGGLCHPLNVPLWFGPEIRKTSDMTYQYITALDDTLYFDFTPYQSDSSIIYQDEIQSFYLIYENSEVATHLDITDSVATYRTAHLDNSGSVINSALHDAPIEIGKELGMIHFFRTDSFPLLLQPIQLVGHAGLQAGLHAIMPKDIFDYEEGDFFQHKFEQSTLGPQALAYTEYRNTTVLSRTETDEFINYTLYRETFKFHATYEQVDGIYVYIPDTTHTIETINQEISKTAVFSQIPLEAQDTLTGFTYRKLLFVEDDCGARWRYNTSGSNLTWCFSDSIGCYGDPSNIAPGDLIFIPGVSTFEKGLGIIYSYGGSQIVSGTTNSQTTNLLYSNKSGTECGEQWVLSARSPEVVRNVLKVYPNPAQNFIRVEIPNINAQISNLDVFDLSGRLVLQYGLAGEDQNYSIEGLPPGVYIVKASTEKELYTQKLVVN